MWEPGMGGCVCKEYLPPTDCDVIFPIPKVIKQNPSPLATWCTPTVRTMMAQFTTIYPAETETDVEYR